MNGRDKHFLKIDSICNICLNTKKYPGSVEVGSIRGEERKEDFDFFLWVLYLTFRENEE